MNDAAAVCGIERLCHLDPERQGLLDRERAATKPFRERLPREVLHDKKIHAINMSDVVQTADVRMIEGGDGARLTEKTRASLGVSCRLARQQLDRYRASQPGIAGPVHVSHATTTQQRQDLVRAQAGTGGNGHQNSRVADYTATRPVESCSIPSSADARKKGRLTTVVINRPKNL